MRTTVIVRLANLDKVLLPAKQILWPSIAMFNRAPQRVMKFFNFALCLWMSDSAEAEANILFDQTHRQPRQAMAVHDVPPGRSMVHQHGFGNSIFHKKVFQCCLDTFASRSGQGL